MTILYIILVILGVGSILGISLVLAKTTKNEPNNKQRTLCINNKSHVYILETAEGDKEFIITSKPKEELLSEFKRILEQNDKEN